MGAVPSLREVCPGQITSLSTVARSPSSPCGSLGSSSTQPYRRLQYQPKASLLPLWGSTKSKLQQSLFSHHIEQSAPSQHIEQGTPLQRRDLTRPEDESPLVVDPGIWVRPLSKYYREFNPYSPAGGKGRFSFIAQDPKV